MSEPVEPGDPATHAARRRRTDVPVGVVVVGMAIAVWWPAFTLGAWGDLFFDQLLTLWAAATAAFAYVVIQRRPVGWRVLRGAVLLLPSVWLLLSFGVQSADEPDLGVLLVNLLGLLAVLLGLPFTVWVLAQIMWPDTGSAMPRRTRWFVVGVVGAVAVGSFLLGVNNAAFMTCEEFTLSGNSEPPGCAHEADVFGDG